MERDKLKNYSKIKLKIDPNEQKKRGRIFSMWLPNVGDLEGILVHKEGVGEENAGMDCAQFGGRMSARGLQNADLEFVGRPVPGAAPFVDEDGLLQFKGELWRHLDAMNELALGMKVNSSRSSRKTRSGSSLNCSSRGNATPMVSNCSSGRSACGSTDWHLAWPD